MTDSEATGGYETMEEIVDAYLPDGVDDPVPAYAEVAFFDTVNEWDDD